MPKIKNWSRRQDLESQDYPYIWHHDDKSVKVEVHDRAGGKGVYNVQVLRSGRIAGNIKKDVFDQEEAREAAVNWMKAHPNG